MTLQDYQNRVNQILNASLPLGVPEQLHEAIRYAVLNGGKRLRPILVYAAGEALKISPEKLDKAACAVELIHAYSLIHDDLPAMDNDDMRRGLPTCHKAFGEATAILAGDALQSLAFQLLAEDETLSPEQRVRMVSVLAKAAGTRGMVGGAGFGFRCDKPRFRCERARNHLPIQNRLFNAGEYSVGDYCGEC